MPAPVYLDHNATIAVAPEVVEAMANALRNSFGNPSSSYSLGWQAAEQIAAARDAVASLIGAQADSLVFTGCATEASNLALLGVAKACAPGKRHLVISAVEHPAVMAPARYLEAQGWRLTIVPVEETGQVSAEAVVDKFHVVRKANEALEKVRKGLRKELTANQRRTLKGDRKIRLKRAHDVSDHERLIMESWMGAFPQLLAAYEHKERFYHIWDCATRRDAENALAAWIDYIPQGQKEVWKELVSAVSGWREEMLAYFETDIPVTNAFTESINRLAKDKNRNGRVYSFEMMWARMLYTAKHKKKAPQTKESLFLGKATMTYSMGLPEPEKNYGVDLSTL